MKPIGVHFTAESIERILDGRKTETRRVLQKQPTLASATMKRLIEEQKEKGVIHWSEGLKDRAIPWQWRVGRELWVRETWRTFERKPDGLDGILYAADGSFIPIESTKEAADQWVVAHANGRHQGRWRPALFLPQWAARIRLRVVAARAERLHEMTKSHHSRSKPSNTIIEVPYSQCRRRGRLPLDRHSSAARHQGQRLDDDKQQSIL